MPINLSVFIRKIKGYYQLGSMKVFRRGIFGRRLSDEVFYRAIRYMRAGKADALIVANLDAISDGIADSYLKIGVVREAGFRLFSVDEK